MPRQHRSQAQLKKREDVGKAGTICNSNRSSPDGLVPGQQTGDGKSEEIRNELPAVKTRIWELIGEIGETSFQKMHVHLRQRLKELVESNETAMRVSDVVFKIQMSSKLSQWNA